MCHCRTSPPVDLKEVSQVQVRGPISLDELSATAVLPRSLESPRRPLMPLKVLCTRFVQWTTLLPHSHVNCEETIAPLSVDITLAGLVYRFRAPGRRDALSAWKRRQLTFARHMSSTTLYEGQGRCTSLRTVPSIAASSDPPELGAPPSVQDRLCRAFNARRIVCGTSEHYCQASIGPFFRRLCRTQ